MIPERIHVLACVVAIAIILIIVARAPVFKPPTAPEAASLSAPLKDQSRLHGSAP